MWKLKVELGLGVPGGTPSTSAVQDLWRLRYPIGMPRTFLRQTSCVKKKKSVQNPSNTSKTHDP